MFWLAEVFNGRYSEEELIRHEQWARQQRAETVRSISAALGRTLARGARAGFRGIKARGAAAYRGYRRGRQRRAAIRQLSGMSDRMLQDIGMSRGDIRYVVDQMLERGGEVRSTHRV
ncbi:MAG TPA: DUF1127 domain-containing protein, partial [Arenicellales bacterium]|nr:DUF1127 domain-containing protein [Arenicellales bacterium]